MRVRVFTVASSLLLAACVTNAQFPQMGQQSSAEFKLAASSASSSSVQSASDAPAILERTLSGGILEIGKSNADVTMQLFVNYSSPYSKQFSDNYLPWLIGDFVQEGNLRIAIIPVAFKKYPRSNADSALLYCGATSGKGLAMNALLFTQPTEKALPLLIKNLGLDEKIVLECAKSEAATKAVTAMTNAAQSQGVTLVPSYTLNGTLHTGLPEYSDLRGQIRAAQ